MPADGRVGGAAAIARRVQADRRPAERLVQPAGDGQHRVAPGLDIQPPAVHPPEQAVLPGIPGESLRVVTGCSAR